MIQRCPICSEQVKPNPRYPRYVCTSCVKRATSSDGQKIDFFQAGALGLYAARYTESGEEYFDHDCLIDGIECYADVARFGGIVVEAI